MVSSARRGISAAFVVLGMVLAAPGAGYAQSPGPDDDGVFDDAPQAGDQQHGGMEGHLPPRQENVDLVSELQLTDAEGGIADVTVFKDTAYLGAYSPVCGEGGVHVVDISDVENPEEIGFIPTGEGSFVGGAFRSPQ